MIKWLDELEKRKDDRGLMADLRCALVESRRMRAYPALCRLGVALDDKARVFVSALYASHPAHKGGENFGATCRKLDCLSRETKNDNGKLSSIEKRFIHLLSAERSELFQRVMRLALYAKANETSIDYEKLETDLRYWNEKTRQAWALAFWHADKDETGEEKETDKKGEIV